MKVREDKNGGSGSRESSLEWKSSTNGQSDFILKLLTSQSSINVYHSSNLKKKS